MAIAPLKAKNTCKDAGDSLPILRLDRELLQTALGDRVISRLSVVLRRAPLGSDPALLLQPQQRGIHCAFIQLQHILAYLLDASRDSKPVLWAECVEGLKNHQVESALQNLGLFGHIRPLHNPKVAPDLWNVHRRDKATSLWWLCLHGREQGKSLVELALCSELGIGLGNGHLCTNLALHGVPLGD